MKKDIISRAKDVLIPYTPLSADCGLVCGKACCKGDEETGMLLFPGEETVFPVKEKNGNRLCVCKGKCDRSTRPLSCIIFPTNCGIVAIESNLYIFKSSIIFYFNTSNNHSH